MNVLIMGRAKTGTTIIAKTIQKSMVSASFLMEPKSIERFMVNHQNSLVAKIIFEHWSEQPYSRLALLNNELPTQFDKSIMILRDPRDELISRMFYIVYGYVKQGKISRDELTPWQNIVVKKEMAPLTVSIQDMISVLNETLGIHINLELKNTFNYFRFINAHNEKLNYLILRYEDFINTNLQPLEDYLGIKLTEERSVDQFNNRVLRTASFNNWKSYFLQSDLDAFKTLHQNEMEAMGYQDWELNQAPELKPEHGSLYMSRILDEAEANFAKDKAN